MKMLCILHNRNHDTIFPVTAWTVHNAPVGAAIDLSQAENIIELKCAVFQTKHKPTKGSHFIND